MGHREKKGRKASINQQLFLFVFNNKENRVWPRCWLGRNGPYYTHFQDLSPVSQKIVNNWRPSDRLATKQIGKIENVYRKKNSLSLLCFPKRLLRWNARAGPQTFIAFGTLPLVCNPIARMSEHAHVRKRETRCLRPQWNLSREMAEKKKEQTKRPRGESFSSVSRHSPNG